MLKDIFLQFSYVNVQFFIFQKISAISIITISSIKDMLFLHSYDLIKDKQPKNSLKKAFFLKFFCYTVNFLNFYIRSVIFQCYSINVDIPCFFNTSYGSKRKIWQAESEAVAWRCSEKKVFLEVSQNSQ